MCQSTPQQYKFKGAQGHVLFFLKENAAGGVCTYSLHSIAQVTGYCVATVKNVIRDLSAREAIEVVRRPGDRRNSYRVRAL